MKTKIMICITLWITPFFLLGQYNPNALEEAKETIVAFNEKDTKFESFFQQAYGYLVFPTVGKGGALFGGASGTGVAYELGEPMGRAKITQFTIGLQFGGQAYSQIVFFETEDDFLRFKQNKIEFAAQASAVILDHGGAGNLAYTDGVAVFTLMKCGLMYEASLGGQKLKYKSHYFPNKTL